MQAYSVKPYERGPNRVNQHTQCDQGEAMHA